MHLTCATDQFNPMHQIINFGLDVEKNTSRQFVNLGGGTYFDRATNAEDYQPTAKIHESLNIISTRDQPNTNKSRVRGWMANGEGDEGESEKSGDETIKTNRGGCSSKRPLLVRRSAVESGRYNPVASLTALVITASGASELREEKGEAASGMLHLRDAASWVDFSRLKCMKITLSALEKPWVHSLKKILSYPSQGFSKVFCIRRHLFLSHGKSDLSWKTSVRRPNLKQQTLANFSKLFTYDVHHFKAFVRKNI